ncbi:hypothetical protein HPB48_017427 [Haemaphysalis longicornis]|uniref:Mutator-like transposase domain-containing protein n=1 Tax=Haemaphysalis longicornis TaxID=44386 RepID=A0A9J6G100_HAELO|nr:hypothetical protein HPB48_017427 [Haemaphysalis longicornis]
MRFLPLTRTALPDFVCNALEPVFTRLSGEALLKRCSDGILQNSNESLCAMIWEQAPKSRHASLRSIERAVAEAISRFNQGLTSSNVDVAENLGYSAESCLVQRSLEKDQARLQRSQKDHSDSAAEQAPKSQHTSLRSIERAVEEAISRFNQGLTSSNADMAENLGYSAGSCLFRREHALQASRSLHSEPFADCCEAESVESAASSYVRPPDAVDRDGRSRKPVCGGTTSAAVATSGVRASNILSRVSAQIPSSEEIAQRAQTRRDVLVAVASKSASKQKLELLNEGGDENDGGKDSTFFIVNKKILNGLLSSAKCNKCNKCDEGSIRLETTHCIGLAERMELFCDNCGIVNSAWSSPRCSGQQKTNPFEVNVHALRAVQSVGRKQSAITDIFSAMDISHRALHHKSYQRLQGKYSHPATTSAATHIEAESAQKVHEIYKDLGGVPGNIDVTYDGTWMTRGHSSHIGVGCVIELYTGLVLDHCVLSNYCQGCAVGPKPGDGNYEERLEKHKPQCQKNHDANAGQREVEAARIMFERSFSKYKLRYINVLCDGDSRTYLALTQDKVYGYVVIKKQECVNHVKKKNGHFLAQPS